MTEAAFMNLWGQVRPYLAYLANRLAAPVRVDADDLISAAAVAAWAARAKLAASDHPGNLAVSVGRMAMLTARRPERRHARCLNLAPAVGGGDALDTYHGREQEPSVDEFDVLLSLADERDRGLLSRRYGDDVTVNDLAAERDASAARVRQLLAAALDRLLARLT